ncbi:DUF2922 domain-containing protein [Bacillus sp. sid0103]|uniref:DUF2922 domain-containing protein n=1 Tax=Bacillus sp. sid0103 TaxID=2856337 RepID=UPI001C45AC96|nr:DUF2922 domain-containing protein [Bacillus sp. sid0103]MBV7504146.1 DUF2922 domain-containing protein [Bacillus sp. sid0103]
MAKTLELQFSTELGKTASLSIENPKEPIDEAVLKQSMAEIIASTIFTTTSGKFVTAKGARVVDRNVIEYELI